MRDLICPGYVMCPGCGCPTKREFLATHFFWTCSHVAFSGTDNVARCVCGWRALVAANDSQYRLVVHDQIDTIQQHWEDPAIDIDHHLAKCRLALAAGLRANWSE